MIKDPVFADMLNTTSPSESSTNTSQGDQEHHGHTQVHTHSHGHGNGKAERTSKPYRDSSQEKVRSTLRSFVRDWSEFGQTEREACYDPCLEILERTWPGKGSRAGKKVLIPGCGLGRLAMEIAARGESCPRKSLWVWLMDRFRGSGEWIQYIYVDCLELCPQSVCHVPFIPCPFPHQLPKPCLMISSLTEQELMSQNDFTELPHDPSFPPLVLKSPNDQQPPTSSFNTRHLPFTGPRPSRSKWHGGFLTRSRWFYGDIRESRRKREMGRCSYLFLYRLRELSRLLSVWYDEKERETKDRLGMSWDSYGSYTIS
jgi:carnosine N-methyltransferase